MSQQFDVRRSPSGKELAIGYPDGSWLRFHAETAEMSRGQPEGTFASWTPDPEALSDEQVIKLRVLFDGHMSRF